MSQRSVSSSAGPTFIQPVDPISQGINPKVGYSWVDTSVDPHLLKTWDGATWVVNDYLPLFLGRACYVSSVGDTTKVSRRLSFVTESCDTLSINLVYGTWAAAAADTLEYGYLFGGFQPSSSARTDIQKLSFSSQTVSSLATSLSISRGYVTAVHDSSAARIGGGASQVSFSPPTDQRSSIDKYLFADDTCAALVSTLRAPQSNLAATQSATDGFFSGGYTDNKIDRIQFSTDATFYLATTMTHTAGDSPCGLSAPGNGYNAGGTLGGGFAVSSIDRLVFSTYAVATISSGLSIARGLTCGGMNDHYGYVFGGYNGTAPSPNTYSVVDRLAFSTETTNVLVSSLGVASENIPQGINDADSSDCSKRKLRTTWTHVQDTEPISKNHGDTWFNPVTGEGWVWDANYSIWGVFSLSSSAGYGTGAYAFSGYTGVTWPTTIGRFLFATEVATTLVSTLTAGNQGSSMSNKYSRGYFRVNSQLDRLTFSTEVKANLSGSLTYKTENAGLDSVVAGYSTGGHLFPLPPTCITVIERLYFASEAMNTLTSGLTLGRENICSVMNRQRGWQMGGEIADNNRFSIIDKLIFSTEATATVATNMPNLWSSGYGLSSPSNGYCVGGVITNVPLTPTTTILKLRFTDESLNSISSGWGTSGNSHGPYSHYKGYFANRALMFLTDTIALAGSSIGLGAAAWAINGN